ncbi:hypothetical protein [Flagellimonas pacifica]|uniref:Uncharacterized protein n=1 Tax=Flagellimonas pacifica TaxID=1247520 RepID=A0A285MW37_9FLAO|nr:hypothetical protein [Allomuricauda parva]SNZ01328.1 hypothetical protein SAMN06265377_3166 [Allomuricauda parva]
MTTYLYALGLAILMLGISYFVGKRMGLSKRSENPTGSRKGDKPAKDEIVDDEQVP